MDEQRLIILLREEVRLFKLLKLIESQINAIAALTNAGTANLIVNVATLRGGSF